MGSSSRGHLDETLSRSGVVLHVFRKKKKIRPKVKGVCIWLTVGVSEDAIPFIDGGKSVTSLEGNFFSTGWNFGESPSCLGPRPTLLLN